MRLKFIAALASVAALGLAASGCVSEGGYYQDSYRPAVSHPARDYTDRSHRDSRYSSRDHRDNRYSSQRDRDRYSSRRDRDRDHTSTHRDRDSHDRDNRDWNDRSKCRPGSKDCRWHK